MSFINPHSIYIDKRIKDINKSKRWNVKITDTTHEEFILTFSSNVFTNFTREIFTRAYLKKYSCSDCNKPSNERCHGIGDERPTLIKRALEKVYPDKTMTITLKDILIAYLIEHKATKFTFKCSECHRKEK
jgi:hypothetical protein